MIPNPYAILAAAGLWLGSLVGVWFYSAHIDSLSWKASIAKQETEASTLLTQLTETAAKKDSAAAEFARNLDEVHTNATHEIALAGDASQRDFTEQLRRIAASRPSCPGTGTAEAINAKYLADSAARGKNQLLGEAASDLRQAGESANRLAALVRDVCIPFANQVGR